MNGLRPVRPLGLWMTGLVVVVTLLASPTTVVGQDSAAPASRMGATRRALGWLAGGVVGLGIHEAGHVLTGAAVGAHPRVIGIHAGPVPFFAIAHDDLPRRREYVVSTSGFWTQQASAEWLLSARPNLRHERAPFLKGVLTFHVVTSAVYGAAGFGRVGPVQRDTRGIAASLGHDGIPEPAIGALVLAPAVFDVYRYWRPESTWAKWASRGAKLTLVGLVLAAGRD